MERGYPPNIESWNLTPFLRAATDSLPFFFEFEVQATESEPAKKVSGERALFFKYDRILEMRRAKQPVDLDDLACFSTFEWLLSSERQRECKELVAAIYKENHNFPAVLPGISGSSKRAHEGNSGDPKKAKAAKLADAVELQVLKMFE